MFSKSHPKTARDLAIEEGLKDVSYGYDGSLPGFTSAEDKRRFLINIDAQNHYNIGLCGDSGVGKSQFMNLIRGLSEFEEPASPVGHNECTLKPMCYTDPKLPYLRMWDLPGAGTVLHPAETYIKDKRLMLYRLVVVCTATRLKEVEIRIIAEMQRLGKKVFVVRLKADQETDNMRRILRIRGANPRPLSELILGLHRELLSALDLYDINNIPCFVVSSQKFIDGDQEWIGNSLQEVAFMTQWLEVVNRSTAAIEDDYNNHQEGKK